ALDKDCIGFLPWLEQVAGAKITNTLSIGKSVYGRSVMSLLLSLLPLCDCLFILDRTLFASKVIHGGDCNLKVPFNAQITPDELPSDVRVYLTDEVGNIGKVATLLMIKRNTGQNSRWFPYISRLPQLAEMHSAIFWDENEFSMIRCSAVHKETVKQKARIEKEFSLVSQLSMLPYSGKFHAFKQHLRNLIELPALENFMYAYALDNFLLDSGISCVGNLKRHITGTVFSMVLRFGLSASIVLSDEDNQLSEVTADRDYSPGDEVQIQMDVPSDYPLRNMKLELLQSHYTRSVNIFHSSYDTFTIKEVKGKGIPQSLRSFARLLCCTSPQGAQFKILTVIMIFAELNDLSTEAEQNDGRLARLPFKDRSKELEAHNIILSHINRLIEDHSVCIKELEASDYGFESQKVYGLEGRWQEISS
ncbi:hypothetical protein DY000_02056231, partial [Brassica cretica]